MRTAPLHSRYYSDGDIVGQMKAGMARAVRLMLIVMTILAATGAARAADALTAGDLGWLRDNLNLRADSPAVINLTDAQKTRLHGLVADGKGGGDRKRQTIVTFLSSAAGSSMEDTLDRARQSPAPKEIGENRPR
jgi:hypothetical protein